MRWAVFGWRVYDIFLLAFAFSHGVNGLRQVLLDYTKSESVAKTINRAMFIFWLVFTTIGAIALIYGVRTP
jgi:succinate dehydrogenase / fumarate reductase membrane anchor subunit